MSAEILPYLLVMTLLLVILMLREMLLGIKSKSDFSKKHSVVELLDELANELPDTSINGERSRTVHEVTHFENNTVFFANGSQELVREYWQKRLPNNFIGYSERQWVNTHWIEQIGVDEISFYNGAEISKKDEKNASSNN